MQQPGESKSSHDARLELFTQHVVSHLRFESKQPEDKNGWSFQISLSNKRVGAGRISLFPKENSSLWYDTTSPPAHFPPCNPHTSSFCTVSEPTQTQHNANMNGLLRRTQLKNTGFAQLKNIRSFKVSSSDTASMCYPQGRDFLLRTIQKAQL